MAGILRNALHGVRGLWRNPGFALVALASLSLSIGANTLVFSVLDSVLLKPLGYPESERLVAMWTINTQDPQRNLTSSIATYFAVRENVRSFEAVGALNGGACGIKSVGSMGAGEPAERLYGQCFSPSLFGVLGITPVHGRAFTDEEDQIGNVAPVALLGYQFWQRRFGGRADVIGQTFPLNQVQTTIIGVLPESFRLFRDPNAALSRPSELDFVIPLELPPTGRQSRVGGITIVGRLRPDATLEQAQTEINTLMKQLGADDPDRFSSLGARLVSLRQVAFGRYQTAVMLLQGVVACVLLVGCANVAGLLLARNRSRRSEIAMRLALGADRRRIVGELVAETFPLSAAGGVIGVALAWVGLRILSVYVPGHFSQLGNVSLDLRALGFTVVVVIVTTFLFATLPALQALKAGLTDALLEAGRGAIGGVRRQRARSVLITAQVTLATMLLIGSGLLINSLVRVLRADLGAETAGLVTFDFHRSLQETVAPLPGAERFRGMSVVGVKDGPALTVERVLERVQRMPGVAGVAASSNPPLGGFAIEFPFAVEGPAGETAPAPDGQRNTTAATYTAVAGDYFGVMRIPLREGRLFDEGDTVGRTPVVIVNQALARRFFPDQSPVGKRVKLDFAPNEIWREIVGVVGDTAVGALDRDRKPTIYLPDRQQATVWVGPAWAMRSGMYVAVRTAEGLASFAPALTSAVAEVDPATPVADLKTMAQTLSVQTQDLQLSVLLLGIFAAVAAVLAATGIYGVIAHAVADRTREIAVRMVAGAGARQIVKMVVSDMIWFVGAGLVMGAALTIAAGQLLRSALFGVTPTDPATYAAVSSLFIAIAIAACLIPTYRAVTISPTLALKAE